MMTATEIREKFTSFFASKGHTIVPSAPIVVKDDPTLLFTNAGMNQFKDYFLGNKKPPYTRVADTQKCLRVSGKHNDLEEVGVDTYHHTMFEMLGNWSFGDYFKKEAIAWSWELLTEVYKLEKDRLYVTIFEGDTKENLPKDEEAYGEWKKVIAEDRILLGNKKDNFWEMGDTGPCGPCTEIHVDCRSDEDRKAVDGKTLVNNDHPQVIEIWNNVFIQFNRVWADKKAFDEWTAANTGAPKEERAKKVVQFTKLENLPAKHVDTGMGFERLVRVIQQKSSNYDTDVFGGTIAETEKISGKKYTNGDDKQSVAFRVLADHIRAIAFTIADGQLPSNNGAGYVIRRILRRAVRYYFSYLDYKQPLLFKLMPLLGAQFREVFPELQQQIDFVSKVVKEEEDAFLRTLDKGLKNIDEIINSVKAGNTQTINGKAAFELYDTYGFPIDLTRLIASENALTVDEPGFEKEMKQQKDRSRAATTIDAEDWIVLGENGSSSFVGYDLLETESRLVKYRKVKAKGKESYQLVLDTTPFYAESGGQVGDTGVLVLGDEEIKITDTKKENNLIIHFADTLPAVGIDNNKVIAKVDDRKRKSTAIHHSATHLLHAALRKVLGSHVAQKGSLVNEDYLRFDFSHFAKVSDEEIKSIEELVNKEIRKNAPVVIREMSKDEAIALGAMALFGEKYGDKVRVVIIDPKYSIELCGGTHVGSTGELGFFKIKHEAAVAAGVRRIEGVSGFAAEQYINQQLQDFQAAKEQLKNPASLAKGIENLVQENSELKRKIEKQEAKQLGLLQKELRGKSQAINGINFIGEEVEVSNADALKKLCFDLKSDMSNFFVILVANIEGKASVAVSIDEALVASKGLEAPKIIKEHVAPFIKGGGGGQKTLATAGGQDVSQLGSVIEKVKGLL